MNKLSSTDVCRLAGITYRQLDHWCRSGVVTPAHVTNDGGGSGRHRRFAPDSIRPLATLGRVSRATGAGGFACDHLARIYAHHDDGLVELTEGVWIMWDPTR